MAKFAVSGDTISRTVGDDTVLLDLPSGKYFSLNNSGALVWDLLSQGADAEIVADQLVEAFAVDREKAAADTDEIIRNLQEAGLITEKG